MRSLIELEAMVGVGGQRDGHRNKGEVGHSAGKVKLYTPRRVTSRPPITCRIAAGAFTSSERLAAQQSPTARHIFGSWSSYTTWRWPLLSIFVGSIMARVGGKKIFLFA